MYIHINTYIYIYKNHPGQKMQSQWVQNESTMWVGLSWRLVIPSAPRGSWEIRRGGLRGPRLFLNTQQQANAITGTGRQWPNQISREGRRGEVGGREGVPSDACSSRLEKLTQMQTSALQIGSDMVWCLHTQRAAGPHVHTNTDQHKITYQLLEAKRYPNKSTFFMLCMITLEVLNLQCLKNIYTIVSPGPRIWLVERPSRNAILHQYQYWYWCLYNSTCLYTF